MSHVESSQRRGRVSPTSYEEDSLTFDYKHVKLPLDGDSLRDEMQRINAVISDINNNWKDRINSLKRLCGLVAGGVLDSASLRGVFWESLWDIRDGLCTSFSDLRSAVVKEACRALCFVSQRDTRGDLTPVADCLVPFILKLCVVSTMIMSHSANIALRCLIKHTVLNRAIGHFITSFSDRTDSLRVRSLEFLQMSLEVHQHMFENSHIATHLEALSKCVVRGVGDASQSVRLVARRTVWALNAVSPPRADWVISQLDAANRKRVMDEQLNYKPFPAVIGKGHQTSEAKTAARNFGAKKTHTHRRIPGSRPKTASAATIAARRRPKSALPSRSDRLALLKKKQDSDTSASSPMSITARRKSGATAIDVDISVFKPLLKQKKKESGDTRPHTAHGTAVGRVPMKSAASSGIGTGKFDSSSDGVAVCKSHAFRSRDKQGSVEDVLQVSGTKLGPRRISVAVSGHSTARMARGSGFGGATRVERKSAAHDEELSVADDSDTEMSDATITGTRTLSTASSGGVLLSERRRQFEAQLAASSTFTTTAMPAASSLRPVKAQRSLSARMPRTEYRAFAFEATTDEPMLKGSSALRHGSLEAITTSGSGFVVGGSALSGGRVEASKPKRRKTRAASYGEFVEVSFRELDSILWRIEKMDVFSVNQLAKMLVAGKCQMLSSDPTNTSAEIVKALLCFLRLVQSKSHAVISEGFESLTACICALLRCSEFQLSPETFYRLLSEFWTLFGSNTFPVCAECVGKICIALHDSKRFDATAILSALQRVDVANGAQCRTLAVWLLFLATYVVRLAASDCTLSSAQIENLFEFMSVSLKHLICKSMLNSELTIPFGESVTSVLKTTIGSLIAASERRSVLRGVLTDAMIEHFLGVVTDADTTTLLSGFHSMLPPRLSLGSNPSITSLSLATAKKPRTRLHKVSTPALSMYSPMPFATGRKHVSVVTAAEKTDLVDSVSSESLESEDLSLVAKMKAIYTDTTRLKLDLAEDKENATYDDNAVVASGIGNVDEYLSGGKISAAYAKTSFDDDTAIGFGKVSRTKLSFSHMDEISGAKRRRHVSDSATLSDVKAFTRVSPKKKSAVTVFLDEAMDTLSRKSASKMIAHSLVEACHRSSGKYPTKLDARESSRLSAALRVDCGEVESHLDAIVSLCSTALIRNTNRSLHRNCLRILQALCWYRGGELVVAHIRVMLESLMACFAHASAEDTGEFALDVSSQFAKFAGKRFETCELCLELVMPIVAKAEGSHQVSASLNILNRLIVRMPQPWLRERCTALAQLLLDKYKSGHREAMRSLVYLTILVDDTLYLTDNPRAKKIVEYDDSRTVQGLGRGTQARVPSLNRPPIKSPFI